MNDLEITKLCAEAMGYELRGGLEGFSPIVNGSDPLVAWNPISNDAQAMQMVKKLCLRIQWQVTKDWTALYGGNNAPNPVVEASEDLNRAICLCVAKMQQAKK